MPERHSAPALGHGPAHDAASAWRAALLLAMVLASGAARTAAAAPVLRVTAELRPTFSVFHDPDGDVSVKEFAFFHNVVAHAETLSTPDTTVISVSHRDLYHLIYQRSGGLHILETTFGHAWSNDLVRWTVDTLAFARDTTWWNRLHVWSPSVVEAFGRTYLFYTGVDVHEDQRIGYVSTAVLDTSNTVWDGPRRMVWEAANTGWAVPDPPLYSGQTQFRDAYVMRDPEYDGCLLMYFDAHDSVDTQRGRGGLVVGVARSDSGSADTWHDLGYFPSTLPSVTGIGQLEGPHLFSVNGTGSGWRMMFSNAGSPPGENGGTTIRFESLVAGESVADTTRSHWSAPVVLRDFLNGAPTSFGWSGSEQLHVAGADYLAGFTAWSPGNTGIAYTRMSWNGSGFTLGAPSVTSVDEYRSPARGLELRVIGSGRRTGEVRFEVESPVAIAARLEVYDVQGRRVAQPFEGMLAAGRSRLAWRYAAAQAASGTYYARLRFAGGERTAAVSLLR